MFARIETFLLGCATVVNTVLLLIVLERFNRRQAAIWLKVLICGAWLWYSASFLHVMLRLAADPATLFLDRVSMTLMATGLALMPCGMLHAALRLNQTGLDPVPHTDVRYAIVYTPLLMVPWAAWLIAESEHRDFVLAVEPLRTAFVAIVTTINTIAMGLFVRVQNRLRIPQSREFFRRLSAMLALITILLVVYSQLPADSFTERIVRLLTLLGPLLPAGLFVWYTLNRNLIPLVVERTLLYGGFLVIVLLFHRLAVSPMTESVQDRWSLDIALVEGAVIVGLILILQPVRGRFRESLRYLLSSNVFQVRDATRQLSVELSQHASLSPAELMDWFSRAICDRIQVASARIHLTDELAKRPGSPDQRHEEGGDIEMLLREMRRRDQSFLDRFRLTDDSLHDCLDRLEAMQAFRLEFRSVHGVILLGRRHRNDKLADEQLTALTLLFDQFAATLHNRDADVARLRAERKSMQQEKLSVLGLLAGSLAHELRNPLSSIRTIASLLKEDSGLTEQQAAEITMIIGEIDRLNQTTQRLLDYSRPADETQRKTEPDQVIRRLMHILEQLARQNHVSVTTSLLTDSDHASRAFVAASDATLSEILFNLIRNAVEAVRGQAVATVRIESLRENGCVVVRVSDNGRGIDPAVQDSLFQPFVTGRADGTGLGLYVAAERVRELRGTIVCHSSPEQGTVFEVRLPLSEPSDTEDMNGSSAGSDR